MVRPSALAETVTPPIVSPDADLTVPVSKTPFSAAETIFGTNAPGTRTTMLTRTAEKKLRLLLITRSPFSRIRWSLLLFTASSCAWHKTRRPSSSSWLVADGFELYLSRFAAQRTPAEIRQRRACKSARRASFNQASPVPDHHHRPQRSMRQQPISRRSRRTFGAPIQ